MKDYSILNLSSNELIYINMNNNIENIIKHKCGYVGCFSKRFKN
jgi:hypothetical protein